MEAAGRQRGRVSTPASFPFRVPRLALSRKAAAVGRWHPAPLAHGDRARSPHIPHPGYSRAGEEALPPTPLSGPSACQDYHPFSMEVGRRSIQLPRDGLHVIPQAQPLYMSCFAL